MRRKEEPSIIGSLVSFSLDHWDEKGNHSLNCVTAKVLNFITDPLGHKEKKYLLEYESQHYGVPISETLLVSPKNGTQLTLF